MSKKRLNDEKPEAWSRAFSACYRIKPKVDLVTKEDLDVLFADGEFKDADGYDTYEEWMAKRDLYEEQRMNIIGQNGNEGLHYDEVRPTNTQVGGCHYKNLGIQPLEMTYKNFGYAGLKSSIYTKVNKYLLRDKESEVEDIKKAIHCLEILLEKAIESEVHL